MDIKQYAKALKIILDFHTDPIVDVYTNDYTRGQVELLADLGEIDRDKVASDLMLMQQIRLAR